MTPACEVGAAASGLRSAARREDVAISADLPRELARAQWALRVAQSSLVVSATGWWPESTEDVSPPPLPGFIVSSFSPLVAEAAERCLRTAYGAPGKERRTAVIIVSALGDVASAVHVARTVDAGKRVGPLMFFQSVPNAVAGYVAARWALTGPVACVGATEDGLAVAALLIDDGDADEALVVLAEQAYQPGERDSAVALLVGGIEGGDR